MFDSVAVPELEDDDDDDSVGGESKSNLDPVESRDQISE